MSASTGGKLFVGNLAWTTDTGALKSAFGQFGDVIDAIVMQDRETGRSRGFGFITYKEESDAPGAIQALNGQELDGREIRVNYANSQTGGGGQRQGGGGYRGGGGSGGYSSGYGGGGYGGDQGGYGADQGGYGGNSTYQSYGGGGYSGGGQGQGNWRGDQQNSYNPPSGGGGNW